MTKSADFESISSQCHRLGNVLSDLDRFLGDLTEGATVHVTMLEKRSIVHITAPSARGGELRGSQWHKMVNRLADLFGPGLITRNTVTVASSHQTPFGVEVVAHVYQSSSNSKATTLEAVLSA